MTIPILGGWAWVRYGYPSVFYFAGGIALLMLVAASRVRTDRAERNFAHEPELR